MYILLNNKNILFIKNELTSEYIVTIADNNKQLIKNFFGTNPFNGL